MSAADAPFAPGLGGDPVARDVDRAPRRREPTPDAAVEALVRARVVLGRAVVLAWLALAVAILALAGLVAVYVNYELVPR